MQRKNSILISLGINRRNNLRKKMFTKAYYRANGTHKRSGFAMIMAVGVIILISTIMLLSLNTTASTSKRTVDLFFYEQAELHTKSGIEYALYRIAKDGCHNSLNIPALDGVYDINISMQYIVSTPSASGCNDYVNTLQSPEQNGSVMMDVNVTISESLTGTEPVRFFRRTIQKL